MAVRRAAPTAPPDGFFSSPFCVLALLPPAAAAPAGTTAGAWAAWIAACRAVSCEAAASAWTCSWAEALSRPSPRLRSWMRVQLLGSTLCSCSQASMSESEACSQQEERGRVMQGGSPETRAGRLWLPRRLSGVQSLHVLV